MKYNAIVDVALKPGYTNPEGDTAADALRGLGYAVDDIRVGKRFEIVFEAADEMRAETVVEKMCRRMLSNPTKDDYSFKIEEII